MNESHQPQRLSRRSSQSGDWANGLHRDAPIMLFRGRRVHPTQSSATAKNRLMPQMDVWSRLASAQKNKALRSILRLSLYGLPDEMPRRKAQGSKGRAKRPCPIRIATRVGARVPRQESPILRAGKRYYTMKT